MHPAYTANKRHCQIKKYVPLRPHALTSLTLPTLCVCVCVCKPATWVYIRGQIRADSLFYR